MKYIFALALTILSAPKLFSFTAQWKFIDSSYGAYNEEVQRICEDNDGLMWFATRYGLSCFDGYRIRTYYPSSNAENAEFGNNINCITCDGNNRIYFTSRSGFGYLDKHNDEVHIVPRGEFTQDFAAVKVLRNGDVLVGYSSGLYVYDKETNKLISFADFGIEGDLPTGASKDIIEDNMGQVWVGTWENGLYRYSPAEKKSYRYPKLNHSNSAYVLFQDTKHNIWVGSWEDGLYKLENCYDPHKVSWTNYTNSNSGLTDNRIYTISQDPATGNIWIGTRSGLIILDENGEFSGLKSKKKNEILELSEIDHIYLDSRSIMWIAAIGNGVVGIDTRPKLFREFDVPQKYLQSISSNITAIKVDSRGDLWLGLGSYGIAKHDKASGEWTFPYYELGFPRTSPQYAIYDIAESESGDLWFASYAGDVVRYSPQRRAPAATYGVGRSVSVPESHVRLLFEDSKGNMWIGTYNGVGMVASDGREHTVPNLNSPIYGIEELDGNIYIGSLNDGVIKITQNADATLAPKQLSLMPESAHKVHVLSMAKDKDGQLAVGTEGNGIIIFDGEKVTNHYLSDHNELRIVSIAHDKDGNLWAGTNRGLWCINTKGEALNFNITNGLPSDIFKSAVFCAGDTLIFGTSAGPVEFNPSELLKRHSVSAKLHFGIVKISILNQRLEQYPQEAIKEISYGKSSSYATGLKLKDEYNNFSIEFGAFTYLHPEMTKFAYMLKGYDSDWIYVDASSRVASYTNLPSGTYEFLLRASNENGIWSDETKNLTIKVLPPWYQSVWANIAYAILFILVCIAIFLLFRRRERKRSAEKLIELKMQKADEVNHSKLVFFTNITHELLTPLTIISAAVEELKTIAPSAKDIYRIMDANIGRLIKLIQQILEFRKAESKNLKLRACCGNLTDFIRKEIDAFSPLIRKKNMTVDFEAPDSPIIGYFDADKIDKILYNLMSNAAKYTPDNGIVTITLQLSADAKNAILKVSDTGKGIPENKMGSLFTRFYDGDYREFKTIGTGIGLSLTRDLIDLHHGTIQVNSKVGEGSTFTVTWPLYEEAYSQDEITKEVTDLPDNSRIADIKDIEPAEIGLADKKESDSILIVEDNEELLSLMVKLMQHEYNVITAKNGQEALDIIKKEMPALIITDLMMPVMDGKQLIAHVKNDLDTSHIPVIVLTAKSATADQVEVYDIGADSYLTKPFDLSVLHSRIKNLLKSRSRRADDFKNQLVVEMKDLEYDSLDANFITNAIGCIEKHLSDIDFDVPQFAEEMGVSKTTLYNKLKSLTGLSPSSFIRNIRLKTSCRIMNEHPDIRISDLAFMVGFNDPKYFSNCFKREFGLTPTGYAERFTQ